jgi:hypothetical protein
LELIEAVECRGCQIANTCTYTNLELSEAVDCRGCQIANTCTYTNLELSEAVEAVHPVLFESLNLFRSLGQNLQRKEKLMKRLAKKTQIPIRGVRF